MEVEPQKDTQLDYENRVTIRPDIVLSDRSRPVLVVDCKYKRLQPSEYKNHDLYQMIAYCTAAKVTRGLLIYPRHLVNIVAELTIRHTDFVIREITIDLAKTGEDLVRECDAMADAVLDWAGSVSLLTDGQPRQVAA